MEKAEPYGMEPLSLQPKLGRQLRIRTVCQVAGARVLERGQVDSDLVGSPSLQIQFQQRGAHEGLEGFVVRDAGPAVRHDRHLVVGTWTPPDGRLDGAGERIGMALNQGVVGLLYLPGSERPFQDGVRDLAL